MSSQKKPPAGSINFSIGYRIGCGRRAKLAREAKGAKISSALVVTDAGVAALPWFAPMLDEARAAGLELSVFSDVRSNPVLASVEGGLEQYRDNGHDGLILVGGGSPMDVGKAIALWANHEGHLFDYEFVGDKWRKIVGRNVPAMVAVPTTSGTGSEVSPGAVISDPGAGVKRTLLHPALTPRAVVADPEVTFALPRGLTATTGMDALTHCFEAYCARGYNPVAEGIALEGLRLINENLERCCDQPDDATARTHMMMAAAMGAIAFQKGLGLVHAMTHPLGAATDIHHGLGNGILLPYIARYNREAIEAKMDLLARHLGLKAGGFDGVYQWILDMRARLDIPHQLRGVSGIDDIALAAELAPKALDEKAYVMPNPRPADEAAIRELYEQAIEGR